MNKCTLYITVLFLTILFLSSCEKDRNMKVSINGDSLNYEVRAVYTEESGSKIDLFITKCNFERYEDISISIYNVELNKTHQPFAKQLGGDSLYAAIYVGIPEFGNQERSSILELERDLTQDIHLVSFDKDEGVIKLHITGFVCDGIPNCTYAQTQYQYRLEAEFEFKIF